jgi:hypothetical protein
MCTMKAEWFHESLVQPFERTVLVPEPGMDYRYVVRRYVLGFRGDEHLCQDLFGSRLVALTREHVRNGGCFQSAVERPT